MESSCEKQSCRYYRRLCTKNNDECGFLFKKFSRGRGETSVIKGTGLGLYVGKQLVEAHGGRIWATSDGKGKGSVFSFALPIGWKPTATSAAYQPTAE